MYETVSNLASAESALFSKGGVSALMMLVAFSEEQLLDLSVSVCIDPSCRLRVRACEDDHGPKEKCR